LAFDSDDTSEYARRGEDHGDRKQILLRNMMVTRLEAHATERPCFTRLLVIGSIALPWAGAADVASSDLEYKFAAPVEVTDRFNPASAGG